MEEYDSEEDPSNALDSDAIPEVDKQHILQYESDDSEEEGLDSSEDLVQKVKAQKADLSNDAWGSKR